MNWTALLGTSASAVFTGATVFVAAGWLPVKVFMSSDDHARGRHEARLMSGMPLFAVSFIAFALLADLEVESIVARLTTFGSDMIEKPGTIFAVSAVAVILGFLVGIMGLLARSLRPRRFRDLRNPGDQY